MLPLAALLLLPHFGSAKDTTEVVIDVPKVVVDGLPVGLKLGGLKPNEVVRGHAIRSLDKWVNERDA